MRRHQLRQRGFRLETPIVEVPKATKVVTESEVKETILAKLKKAIKKKVI